MDFNTQLVNYTKTAINLTADEKLELCRIQSLDGLIEHYRIFNNSIEVELEELRGEVLELEEKNEKYYKIISNIHADTAI